MLPDGAQTGLFLTPIQVPRGDPAALAAAARTYTAGQGEIERNRTALTAAAGQVGGPAWQGMGATAYSATTRQLAACYALTSSGLSQGAITLRAYSADLAAAQEAARQANAAITESNAAASGMLAAQDAAAWAQSTANDASQTATTAEAHAAANPHSPAATLAAQDARQSATDAQTAADGAAGRLTTATLAFDGAHSRALSLMAHAQSLATSATTRAAAGFDAAAAAVAGDKPHSPRGGATGVPAGGAWSKLASDIGTGNGYAGVALNAWGTYGGFVFGKASLNFFEAIGKFQAAAALRDQKFYDFYGSLITERTASYWDFDAADRAKVAARTAETEAGEEVRTSLEGDAGFSRTLGQVGLGAAMVSDVVTEWQPSTAFGSAGAVGDRVNSGLNFAASGLVLGDTLGMDVAVGLMAVPGVDVVVGGVLVATTLYATSELVWTHFSSPIKHATHAVGHFFDDVGHDIASIF
jgi:hypothetical protein